VYCWFAERALLDSLAYYGDALVVIGYHPDSTYVSTFAQEREDYYDTGLALWYAIFDGTDVVFESQMNAYDSVFAQHVDVARGYQPLFNLYIESATATPSTADLAVRIVTADTIPEDEIALFYTITEDSLPPYGVPPFMTFYRVCRQQYSFPLSLAYPDSIVDTLSFSHAIPADKMKAVVFVQDITTKEVLQSVITSFQEE
jgi:hypothetical protein